MWVLFFLIPFLYSVYVSAQSKKERDCNTTCFSSEVVSVEKVSDTCTAYELKVSFAGDCAHALSHFSVAVPCGKIENIWNSQNWALEIGTDPTTGLAGFKIDNTSNFGESALNSFTVKFNICSSDEGCADQLRCWQPLVAYKASTCVNYQTLTVACRSLKASLEKTDLSCAGAEDGSLSVVIEEGQEPYTFMWTDNATEQLRTGLSAGNYSVTVTDASGASLTLEETLSQPEAIAISGVTTPASCNGIADGSIDLTVSGGAGPYAISWSNGLSTEDIQSIQPGQYAVTVTDEADCQATATFTIEATSKIAISAITAKAECDGTGGSIDLTVTGGTAPYTFAWSNDASSEDLQNIGAGVYTVVVSDASGCSAQANYWIKENNTLLLAGVPDPTSCIDDASGAIDLTVKGGTAPYTYDWSNGEHSEDLSGLTSGTYTVTVRDAKGCSLSKTFSVVKQTFQISRSVVQPTCYGDSDGSITLEEPIGGTGPFTYEWSNGQTGTSLTGLDAGTYSVTVTDAAGCSRTLTVMLTEPGEIVADARVSNQQCNAEGYFMVDLSVSGGTAPYTYQWSNGSTTEDLEGLQTGTYTVVVTDASGCSLSKEVTVAGEEISLVCTITEPPATPLCSSQNNTLSSTVADADSYVWTIQSSDGNWSIGDAHSPSVVYTAGGENSTATFSLTVVKDGCTKTCSYTIAACTPQDNGGGAEEPGGEDPGGEDPDGEAPGSGDGGDQTCEECFDTAAKLIAVNGSCRTYEMEVSTNGLCRHDLSHWTLAIPCGTVSNYFNSEGWKMEFGKDPTTGLYGLKVDDINYFGKETGSFTVTFTVCESNDCALTSWSPEVAYKAGLCVGIETVDVYEEASATAVSVYPNPFTASVNFEWTSAQDEVNLEIIDQYGNRISHTTAATGDSRGHYITLESSSLPKGMYYYRLTLDGKTYNGKISKR